MEAQEGSKKRQGSSQKSPELRQNSSSETTSTRNRTTTVQAMNQVQRDWNTEVETFRVCLQDAKASDDTVQSAWARLRRSYRNTFNAVAHPHGRNEDLEPFPLWAAENIEEDILERVIRIEFSSSLATCLLSRLQSVAALSDLSIYTLILYFGSSFFVKGRVLAFRKRVYIFQRSTSNTWPFTEGYKRMLCEAAALSHKALVDTTDIPSRGMTPLFTERILNHLAPANPEFQREAEKKEKRSVEPNETALSGIPISKKFFSTSSKSLTASPVRSASTKDDRGSPQTVVKDTNDRAPKQRAGQSVAQSQKDDPRSSLRPTGLSKQHRSTRNCNFVLPSIESDDGSEATSSPYDSKLSSTPGLSKLMSPTSQANMHFSDEKRKSSSRKRPIKEECDLASQDNPSKRFDATNSKSDLLLQAKDWDDETIIIILKQLEAIRPDDFLLINCLEVNPEQVSLQKRGNLQILLIPFKLQNGQRLLALVSLITDSNVSEAGKQGYIQYLNPACMKGDENKGLSRIAVEFLQVLGRVLPGYSSSPERWHFQQNYPCPNHVMMEDGGLALCLAALSVVGGPLRAPLATQTDWMFWRQIILSSFFPEDNFLQLRAKEYLKGKVEREVRQFQSMVVTSYSRESFDNQMQLSRQVIVSPQDRLWQREIHTQSLLQTAQEAGHILQNLTDHVYQAIISVKHSLDRAKLHRAEHHSKNILKAKSSPRSASDDDQQIERQRAHGAMLEEIDNSIRNLEAKTKKAYELHHCLKNGRDLISHYRKDIINAVESRS